MRNYGGEWKSATVDRMETLFLSPNLLLVSDWNGINGFDKAYRTFKQLKSSLVGHKLKILQINSHLN